MKVVVFSDVHGAKHIVKRILSWNKDADYYLSLGDTELETNFLLENHIIMVKGNYRGDAGFVYERDLQIEGVKIFMTHGHLYHVGRSLKPLEKRAKEEQYDLVLFGHTHILEIIKSNKVTFLNPGSCARPRNNLPPTYAILDITDKKITITIKDSIDNRTLEV